MIDRKSIRPHNKWGFFVKITKLEIFSIDYRT